MSAWNTISKNGIKKNIVSKHCCPVESDPEPHYMAFFLNNTSELKGKETFSLFIYALLSYYSMPIPPTLFWIILKINT